MHVCDCLFVTMQQQKVFHPKRAKLRCSGELVSMSKTEGGREGGERDRERGERERGGGRAGEREGTMLVRG